MNNNTLRQRLEISPSSRQRRSKARDLASAITLRPAEIFTLYGIPKSTLSGYCTNPDATVRLPSRMLPGRRGHKGARYVEHADLRLWLDRWWVAA